MKSGSKSKAKTKRTATKRANKGKKAFGGKGRKVGDGLTPTSDGESVAEDGTADIAEDDLDDEAWFRLHEERMEEHSRKRKEDNERMAPIRKAEAALKKKLGRKLTNGERNSIRLVQVSFFFAGLRVERLLQMLNLTAPP